MYEKYSDFQRWKNLDPEFKTKYSQLKDFTANCIENCQKNPKGEFKDCKELCLAGLVNFESYNLKVTKALLSDTFELCDEKHSSNEDLFLKVRNMNDCVNRLYDEKLGNSKYELLHKLDSLLKYLK